MSRQKIVRGEPALEVAELYPPQGEWTEEDYFALPDTNRYVELSEGRLIMPPHPTDRHQATIIELAFQLRIFVLERDLGVVRIAPLPVRLWPGKIQEPDILFVAKEHIDHIGEKVYEVPDLAVERNIEVYTLKGDAYTLLGRHEPGQTAGSKILPDFRVSVDEVFSES